MMNKTCFKCKRALPLDEFYKHSQMADGHLNKCKECSRLDTRQNRRKKSEYYQEYDRQRSRLPHRVARRKEVIEHQRFNETSKYHARTIAGNALRDGRLEKEHCYFCNSEKDVEMHHPDYNQH